MPGWPENEPQRGLAGASRVQAIPRGPQALTPHRGLGKAIRSLREEAGMTQATLAERAGISASWISRVEHGQVDPTWATIVQIAAGLGVSMVSLAELTEDFEETNAG
jgi:DNA-binding XRE family transcriptional regulator